VRHERTAPGGKAFRCCLKQLLQSVGHQRWKRDREDHSQSWAAASSCWCSRSTSWGSHWAWVERAQHKGSLKRRSTMSTSFCCSIGLVGLTTSSLEAVTRPGRSFAAAAEHSPQLQLACYCRCLSIAPTSGSTYVPGFKTAGILYCACMTCSSADRVRQTDHE
jgi:hypothetical protein